MSTDLLPPDPDAPTPAPADEGGVMGFWDHVEELRWVLIKSLTVFAIAFGCVLGFAVWFADALQWPLLQAFKMLGEPDREILLRTDGPLNVFTFLLQLGFFGGIAVSLPFVLGFVVKFVAPGLTKEERAVIRPICLTILILFFLGACLGFFLLVPFYLYVSLKFEQAFNFASLWTPVKYYGLVVWTALGLGIIFQSPLVIVTLIYLDIVSVEQLREGRRYAIVFILIVAALITPGGDPITLAVTAVPLLALYEGALFVGARLRAKKKEPEWE